jgi:hypothetical protein
VVFSSHAATCLLIGQFTLEYKCVYITAACCGEIINILQTQYVFDVESLHTATCFGNRRVVRDFFFNKST